jgi:threonine/homoserine/homoserine lactone efflux protein
MIVIPLIALILLAVIAAAWSPIFALVIFAVGFFAYLAYTGFSRSADERATTPEAQEAARGRREESETRIR